VGGVQHQHRGDEARQDEQAPVDGGSERQADQAHERRLGLERAIEVPLAVELRDAPGQRIGWRLGRLSQSKLNIVVQPLVHVRPGVGADAIRY
jgi:hypothetical protein